MLGLAPGSFDRLLLRWSEGARTRAGLVPLVRAYIRYCPLTRGKVFVWTRVVEPYLAWQPHAFRARTTFGARLEGDSKDLIQQWVYYFGVWEPALTAWIRKRLQPGDTFVDVGANVGYFALLGATCVGPSGRVVAVEASPTIFASLERNVTSNAATNVRIVNAAALGSRAIVRLYRGNDANCGETTIVEELGASFECEVEGFPLSEILTPTELESARLIKIDVEGAEYAVLAGIPSLGRRLRADAELIVEVHPEYLAKRGESLDALLALMEAEGFVAYVLHEEYWGPNQVQKLRRVDPPQRLTGPVPDGTALIFSRVRRDTLE